jgi:hypothetical protein
LCNRSHLSPLFLEVLLIQLTFMQLVDAIGKIAGIYTGTGHRIGEPKAVKRKHFRRTEFILCTLLSGILGLSSSAIARQTPAWEPNLEAPANSEFRAPTDPIRFFIPPEVPVEVLQRLSLELDDIDVTAMVSREGSYAILTPAQPLAWGRHRARIVEYAADGSVIERGYWEFEVRKSRAFREADLQVDASLEVSRRVGDKNLSSAPEKTQSSGSMNIQGALADGDWRATLQLPLMYDSQSTTREIEAGNFLFGWERKGAHARLGHHPMAPDSLVMSGFDRRGVSAGYVSPETGAGVTGFVMRGSQITGFQDGWGIGDESDRVKGAVATFYPVRENDRTVELSAVYLSGESPDAGVGVFGDPESTGGDAWSMRADSLLLDNRLRVRAEVAATEYDFDGSGGNSAEDDQGLALLMTYRPWLQKQVGDDYLDWNFGLEYRRMGTYFRSPAAPGMVADREMGKIFTDLMWGEIALQAQLAEETDNVEDIPSLPRLRTRLATLNLSYTPSPEYDDQGVPMATGWLGQPSYSLFANVQDNRTVQRASTAPGDFIDTRTHILGLNASFSYDSWNWGPNLTWTRVYDDSVEGGAPTTNDTETISSGINASFTFLENYSFSPRIQWDVTKYYDLGYSDKARLWGFGLNADFIPGKLSGSFNYDLNRPWTTDDTSDNRTETMALTLSWVVVPPRESRPGLTLSLTGNYSDYEDYVTVGSDSTNYQLFLKALIGWSGTY